MGRPRADTLTEATPERLLDAAAQAFAELGFAQATLADIAKAAGIRRPSLLYHFRSKEELYAAAVERTFSRLRRALLATMQAEGDFRQRLSATVNRYAQFLAAEPHVARIIVREFLDGQGPGAQILLHQIVPLLATVHRFIRETGTGVVRPQLPIRAAVLCIASDILLRSAAGELRKPIWGPRDESETLAHVLFLDAESPESSGQE
jgi:AcrR family transcriptional regulator